MRFDLRTRPGDANIKSLSVTLPKAFAIDQRHLGNICSKAQLESESCAGRQPIGSVMTKTPLLDAPLQGPAYAVSGFGKLPHLAFILDGQVRLVPQAESKSVGGRLQTSVPTVPDAPIGHFRLNLLGGKKGYLVNTKSLCKGDSTVVKSTTPARTARHVRKTSRSRPPAGRSRSGPRGSAGTDRLSGRWAEQTRHGPGRDLPCAVSAYSVWGGRPGTSGRSTIPAASSCSRRSESVVGETPGRDWRNSLKRAAPLEQA